MAKKRTMDVDSFVWCNIIISTIMLPCFLLWPNVVHSLLPLWPWLLLTGAFQALYYLAIIKAYASGEMSSAYPLLRTLPIIFTTLVVMLLQQEGWQSTPLLAMAIIVCGCVLMCLRVGGAKLSTATIVWSVLAACGTTGYHWVDDYCLRQLAGQHSAIANTLVYSTAEWLATTLMLGAYALLSGQLPRRRPSRADTTLGIGIFLSYTLALAAMPMCDNVAWAVAFRQLSIPLGAVLGIIVLGESASLRKLAGIACISCGLLYAGLGH